MYLDSGYFLLYTHLALSCSIENFPKKIWVLSKRVAISNSDRHGAAGNLCKVFIIVFPHREGKFS